MFGAAVEVTADGYVIMRRCTSPTAVPITTQHCAPIVAEMLGFTSRDRVRVIWGDSDVAPASGMWSAGKTITLQGAAVCAAADKLRKDLLRSAFRQSCMLDPSRLQLKDGVISSMDDPKKRTTFTELVALNKGPIRQEGRGTHKDQGRSMTKGVAACFVEVEVDTWTGDWRFVRTVYSHDVGLVVNPLVGEADMHGSLVQSIQMTTDSIPWDREFPGTRHYSVGYSVVSAADDHGCPDEPNQHLHRQPGTALVLRYEELQRNSHRRRSGRYRKCNLQCLWRAHPRTSDYAREDHGGLEEALDCCRRYEA